ncbi:flagellar basal-body MS-ring/collar protein FliF [Bacillus sp. FJAT-52991]|uniref:Flagellar M-ring protein n=1 Tax=Bacillus kandeliae TaxID=3129297 RepID=A0ABZ2N9C3_9BACI
MNDKFSQQVNRIKEYWNSRTKKQKMIGIGAFLLFVAAITVTVLLATKKNMVPLYSDLSPTEIGAIKENLDGRGVTYEITEGGTGILVPSEVVDTLKVDLAAEGLPKSGSIDYSFFSENAGFGMTDNEFDIMKLDAMQTELAQLMTGIEGVKDAKVMITLPEEDVFVKENGEKASASVVLNTEPGYEFDEKQIKSLYHLVSKSVPNLPTENIVIMNQNFEYFDIQNGDSLSGNSLAQQMDVKREIERDIQRQVQNMLGTLMGPEKVVVSVTADVDFTQEKREENLVTPVDEENMEGIQISAQRITETFTGDGAAGGVPQGEDPADALGSTYMQGTGESGDYERTEETINNEVNRIRKVITESPYKIRDLGIQVMVEPPKADDPDSLPQESVDDIQQMLGTIVRTSIDKDYGAELTDQDVEDKIAVSVQPFNGKVDFKEEEQPLLPWWAYVIGGILLVVIGVLVFLMIRSRRNTEEEEEEELEEFEIPQTIAEIKEVTDEGSMKRKQLEKMAKDKPEEFAKLLRSWLSED